MVGNKQGSHTLSKRVVAEGSSTSNDSTFEAVVEDIDISNITLNFDLQPGCTFASKFDLRKAICKLALKQNFCFKTDESDMRHYNVSCVDDKCEWSVTALAMTMSKLFAIKKYVRLYAI